MIQSDTYGSLGVNFCNLTVLLSHTLSLSYITAALGLGNINTSLIDGTLVGLS
jgi:hypothetical protein